MGSGLFAEKAPGAQADRPHLAVRAAGSFPTQVIRCVPPPPQRWRAGAPPPDTCFGKLPAALRGKLLLPWPARGEFLRRMSGKWGPGIQSGGLDTGAEPWVLQRRRPPPVADAGRSGWGRGQQYASVSARMLGAATRGSRRKLPEHRPKRGQKSYQARFLPKMRAFVCAESSDLSIAFFRAGGYNQTIDSNGAVGHLLTRSAVFVKTLFAVPGLHLRRPGAVSEGKEQ